MHAIRIKIALLAMTLALTGCITKPEKAAKSEPAIQKPTAALVIHQLELNPSKNGQSTHATIDFTNQTGRELSYVMFKATAFDNKGHIVRANKSGAKHAFLRVAGPFSKDSRSGGQRWEQVWTQNRPSCVAIESAELIFSDSSVEEIPKSQIKLQDGYLEENKCLALSDSIASN
jgi:hypothetical protein